MFTSIVGSLGSDILHLLNRLVENTERIASALEERNKENARITPKLPEEQQP